MLAGLAPATTRALLRATTPLLDFGRFFMATPGTQALGEAERSQLGSTAGVEEVYKAKLGKLFDLSGSVAFVTGAAHGMGARISHGLALHGAKVALADIDAEGLQSTEASLRGMGVDKADVMTLRCDVRDRRSVQGAMAAAVERLGGLHVVVANAGILGRLESAEALSDQTWDEVMAVDLRGVLHTVQAAYPHLRQAGRGKVVLMSSIAGIRGFGAQAAYCAAKGALLPLCKSFAVAWGRHNIQVNCLLPGAINTGLLDAVLGTPDKVEYILGRIPAGRLGVGDDVVGPVVFLASHASDYVTGTELVVDGGGTAMPMLGQQRAEDYRVPPPPQPPQQP